MSIADHQHPPEFGANFEDFFNLDMLGGAATASSTTSPAVDLSASSSPGSASFLSPDDSTFAAMPPTPPQPSYGSDDALLSFDSDSVFNMFGSDTSIFPTVAKPPSLTVSAPFDFFGLPFDAQSAFASSSQTASSTSSVTSPSMPMSIDPHLMDSPAPRSEADDEEDQDEDDDELPPIKVGGKGKTNRRGTVASGGIVKKLSKEKVEKDSEPDDWRPSPEEYKKMSSKEKRQLRNKISARNFRIRRKEYITTLEGEVEQRDQLIDAIKTQLDTTRDENFALRQEIEQLKKMIMDGRISPVLPPPAPLSPVSPVASTSSSQSTATTHRTQPTTLATANTQKDLPTSPRLASTKRGFWGGSALGGGITPVHTTLVPDLPLSAVLSGKIGSLQENMNPSLNGRSNLSNASGFPAFGNHNASPFDSFADSNPFTLKTLDPYRMHLWSRLASQSQLASQTKPASSSPPSSPNSPRPELTGMASQLKRQYFVSSGQPSKSSASNTNNTSVSSLAGMLAGKCTVSSVHPSPPSNQDVNRAAAAAVAIASQTLMQRLGSAFWDAFSGHSAGPAVAGSSHRPWDADKVRRVLEGRAVLQVVDIEPTPEPQQQRQTSMDCLERSMRGLNVSSQIQKCRENCVIKASTSVFGRVAPTAVALAASSKASKSSS